MKHLKIFKTDAEYNSATLELPNVSYIENDGEIIYTSKTVVPTPPPVVTAPVGASIYGLDGEFYSAEEWTASGKNNTDAVGVAFSDGEHSFLMHPDIGECSWSSSNVTVSGVTTIEEQEWESDAVFNDFAGKSNTEAILAAVQNGTIVDAPAAQYATSATFLDGRKGYLPSAGELNVITKSEASLRQVNDCYIALGKSNTLSPGDPEGLNNVSIWTSTQYSSDEAHYYMTGADWMMMSGPKDRDSSVLVFASL